MLDMWQRLDMRARVGLLAGCVVVLALAAALAVWAYRPDYQVLFAEMAPRDAAAMVGELDKAKTPYRLADNGNTILVPKDMVYKTRLKLMGTDVPLHGAVGFEVFNNADFGMTDFVQKVNYQRAIQGELTRTILSIDEIQAARVHLALPEQGLFKKAAAKPKASVTITAKPGRVLEPAQVAGIQRLVAASVPDIAAADVTVLDQHGIALTRVATGNEAMAEGASQLDSKRLAEDYIGKKVAQVLDKTFGAGEAIASVDLVLDLDQTKVTTDEVLPSRKATDDTSPTGVVVHERHTIREGEQAQAGAAVKNAGIDTTTAEADYQVGRRVQQVSVAPGAVKRMTIAVVVKRSLSEDQRARLREVVALAAGLSSARGDAIVVSTIDSLVTISPPVPAPETQAGQASVETGAPARAVAPSPAGDVAWWIVGTLALAFAGAALHLRRRASRAPAPARLDAAERARLVADIKQWMQVSPDSLEHRK